MRKFISLMGLFLVLAVLAACAPAAAPTPAPTVAPAPTIALAPTTAPVPTQAPSPTAAPRPTPTLAPVAVAQVTPTPAGEKARYGGVLATINRIDIANFDLHQQTTALSLMPLAPFYSTLVQPDLKDPTKVVPDLAERWDISPDGKVYTYHLRKGVKFHDGNPLTSADVLASWSLQAFPKKGVYAAREGLYNNVDKLEAPDDYTFKVTLKAPQGGFLLLSALPWAVIYPKAYLDKYGDMKKQVMGSGPFKFVEYARGVSITAERNPDYFFKDRPYLDGIKRYIILDTGAQSAAFRSGQVDLLQGFQFNFSPQEREVILKENPGIKLQKALSTTLHVIQPNVQQKPWGDKRVRQAVNLALDKWQFVDVVQRGDAVVGGFLFPGSGWARPLEEVQKLPGFRKPTTEDLAQAKKLLAEAGFPQGFKFLVLSRTLGEYTSRAVLTKDHLAKIGVEVEIDIKEDATYYSMRQAGAHQIDIGGVVSPADDPDQYLGYAYLTNSGANYGKYSNKTMDDLYLQQSRAIDPAERKKLLWQIDDILMDELPVFPNYWRIYTAMVGPKVKDYIFTGIYNGGKLEHIWLAP